MPTLRFHHTNHLWRRRPACGNTGETPVPQGHIGTLNTQSAIPIALAALLLALLSASCSGPQPLKIAINPDDESAYLAELNKANMNGREAFIHWMSKERGLSAEELLRKDAQFSTTRNRFDANTDHKAVSRGAVIFKYHCVRCHGEDARGLGPASLPNHPAGDFHTFSKRFAATLHRGAPRTWYRKITQGFGEEVTYPDQEAGPAMPPFSDQLTREQIWLAITYLQSLDIYADKDHRPTGDSHE